MFKAYRDLQALQAQQEVTAQKEILAQQEVMERKDKRGKEELLVYKEIKVTWDHREFPVQMEIMEVMEVMEVTVQKEIQEPRVKRALQA